MPLTRVFKMWKWIKILGILAFLPAIVLARGRVRARVRVGWVDTSNPGAVRVVLSAVNPRTMQPVNLSDFEYLRVDIAQIKENQPQQDGNMVLEFRNQGSVGANPGTFSLAKDAKAPLYIVFVVAMHGYVSQSVESAVREGLVTALKPLKKDTRIGLILYGDRIRVLTKTGEAMHFMDINEDGQFLAGLRDRAITGKTCFFAPGVLKSLKTHRFHTIGMFPKLWGIQEDLIEQAKKRGNYPMDAYRYQKKQELFARGAIEAAARMIMAMAPRGSERVLVLLSDGRDGYLDAQTVFATAAAGRCQKQGRIREALQCLSKAIANDVRPRYQARVRYLKRLIPLLQAMNLRVFVVSYPGSHSLEEQMMQALAAKTGGTFRSGRLAARKGFIGLIAQTTTEIAQEAVITLDQSLDTGQWYAFYALAQQQQSKHELESRHPYIAFVAPRPFIAIRLFNRLEGLVIAKAGNDWGPPLTWVLLVLVILLIYVFISGIIKLIKGLKNIGKAKKLQKAARSKLKRKG